MKIKYFIAYAALLYQYCKQYGFYTKANDYDYEQLLVQFRTINQCTDMEQVYSIVENVAEDIVNKSALYSYFGTRDETIEFIINDILNGMVTIRYTK